MSAAAVTVGILLAEYPPYRSVRAVLPHTALTSGINDQNAHSEMGGTIADTAANNDGLT